LALVLEEEEEDFRDTPPGGLLIILQDKISDCAAFYCATNCHVTHPARTNNV